MNLGKLTLNVGYLGIDDEFIKIKMNLRIPVHYDITKIGCAFIKTTNSYPNLDFDTTHYMPSLYIDPSSKLVQLLCNIYNEETNSNCKPIAIRWCDFCKSFSKLCFIWSKFSW